jgi:hypothetical protein
VKSPPHLPRSTRRQNTCPFLKKGGSCFVFRSGETRVFRFSRFFNDINAETCFETLIPACFGLVIFSYARNAMFRLFGPSAMRRTHSYLNRRRESASTIPSRPARPHDETVTPQRRQAKASPLDNRNTGAADRRAPIPSHPARPHEKGNQPMTDLHQALGLNDPGRMAVYRRTAGLISPIAERQRH